MMKALLTTFEPMPSIGGVPVKTPDSDQFIYTPTGRVVLMPGKHIVLLAITLDMNTLRSLISGQGVADHERSS